MVTVRVIAPGVELSQPVSVPKFELSDKEWRERLTLKQYQILRSKGTEAAFCGGLLKNKEEGIYICVGCGLPLFASSAKFESGTGWPSFFQPVAAENVAEKSDVSYGMTRTEILCARCDGHLGHVFDDGPPPTGRRHCLNSESLEFVPTAKLIEHAEQVKASNGTTAATSAEDTTSTAKLAEAIFAGGCFWCVEGVFQEIDGVKEAISGYAGGDAKTANYQAVSTGNTGHAEVVKIVYDPAKVTYDQLLKIHFATHNPTTKNRQGADVGTQYRSTIFYADEAQKQAAEAYIRKLTEEKAYGDKKIETTLEPLDHFYTAEEYHQDYAERNPLQPYIQGVAAPKIEKTREKFADLLKNK